MGLSESLPIRGTADPVEGVLDLSNDGIRGETLSEWSFALNWVLFSNMRVSNNYVLSATGDRPLERSGIAHSWVTRFQIDF